MRRLLWLGLLLASACAPKDPLAAVRTEYPAAEELRASKKYVLVRFPVDDSTGDQPAVLLQRDGREYRVLGKSKEGFTNLPEVMTFIPEMDESGVEALDLH